MNELKYLSQFETYKQISKGMSGDEKYHCMKDGNQIVAYVCQILIVIVAIVLSKGVSKK